MIKYELDTNDAFHNIKIATDNAMGVARLRQSRRVQEMFENIRVLARNERQQDWLYSLGKLNKSIFRMAGGKSVQWIGSAFLKKKIKEGGVVLIESGDMFDSLFIKFRKQSTADLVLVTTDWKAGIHQHGGKKDRPPSRPFAFVSTELRQEFSGRYAWNVVQMLRAQWGLDTGKKLYGKVAERHYSVFQSAQGKKGASSKRRKQTRIQREKADVRHIDAKIASGDYTNLTGSQLFNSVKYGKIQITQLDKTNIQRYYTEEDKRFATSEKRKAVNTVEATIKTDQTMRSRDALDAAQIARERLKKLNERSVVPSGIVIPDYIKELGEEAIEFFKKAKGG